MEFVELVTVWYPQATKIFGLTQQQEISNLVRALRVGKQSG